MKRHGCFYEDIYLYPNLCDAFHKASKGRQNDPEVVEFRKNFAVNIDALQKGLRDQSPDIGHYTYFVVRDPKTRLICAASFPERVLHHAIMNICGSILDAPAIHDSYACRTGKGSHLAVKRAQFMANQYQWFLKLDIRKYFDSIDHNIMLRLLDRKIKDQKIVLLLGKIMETYHSTNGKGLPIGNLTSQHLANYYLCYFDHWIKEQRKVKGYIRYMDDFILFRESSEMLKADLNEIQKYLNTYLKLSIKPGIQLNRSKKGIPFLGYRVFPQKVLLLPSSKKRFIHKLVKYELKYEQGIWSEEILSKHLTAMIAFIAHADSKGFQRNTIQRFGVSSYGLEPGDPRRQLEQQRQELSVSESEQQQPWQHEQQPGLSAGLRPQYSGKKNCHSPG